MEGGGRWKKGGEKKKDYQPFENDDHGWPIIFIFLRVFLFFFWTKIYIFFKCDFIILFSHTLTFFFDLIWLLNSHFFNTLGLRFPTPLIPSSLPPPELNLPKIWINSSEKSTAGYRYTFPHKLIYTKTRKEV